ncbi:ClpP domain-containing protein [Rozella allomycis CSF55]|uniref:ATP-dependent Clp protease proteolytic subunit n=1 Tax=Rozella allomycis (strain CSF55) TaxID=988480 RepID=A0A075B1Z7_ROZAC|nr:ClpP domain-containing protein [Rozella allomycis CSF55]|eukprot:EPZ36560.1 ClpP domain-containing protein [Rozella allomycis CSF55]
MTPVVIDNVAGIERHFDIYSRLLADRIVLMFGPVIINSKENKVDTHLARTVTAQLLFLESQGKDKPIQIYINSPGGSVSDGLAIYDTMQVKNVQLHQKYIKCPISTVCMGMAASMGSFLLASGRKGMRYALPNSRVMVHQPSGGAQGQASDIAIVAKEILQTRERLNKIYSFHTGQEVSEIEKVMERDTWMNAEEAKKFGIVDHVIIKNETDTPKN